MKIHRALLCLITFTIASYAMPGDLDKSFGVEGTNTPPTGTKVAAIGSIAIQEDGKILAAGWGHGSEYGSYDTFIIARYNRNGLCDSVFGNDDDGVVKTSIDLGSAAYGIAVQSDGKIVAVGYSKKSTGNKDKDFTIVRYNSDGSLDSTFGSGGIVTTDFGNYDDIAYSVAIQHNGKIVVAGYTENNGGDFAIVRYNSNGEIDSTFGSDGKVTTDFGSGSDKALGVAIQSNYKIVAAGYGKNGSAAIDFAIARYNIDGSLDTSFDSDGKVMTGFFGSDYSKAYDIAIQQNGGIVVAGFKSSDSGDKDFAIVRYNSNGTRDAFFGRDATGKVTTDFGSDDDEARGVAIQKDGKIVVAGFSSNTFALSRYTKNGFLDSAFGGDGKVTTEFYGDAQAGSIAIQNDGKIVVGGLSKYYNSSGLNARFALARYFGDYVILTPIYYLLLQ